MTERAGETSLIKEICTHLAALTQAVKTLQDSYARLEGQVLNLTGPGNVASASAAALTQTVSSPSVVMLPPEPRVPIPERFSGDRTKFWAFRSACQLYFARSQEFRILEIY